MSFCFFLPFDPPNNTKNKNLEKKTPGDNILHLCTTNDNHMMYGLWFLRYQVQQTEFFVILGYFLPFCPPNNPQNQTFEKMKKTFWRYYHFTHEYHK